MGELKDSGEFEAGRDNSRSLKGTQSEHQESPAVMLIEDQGKEYEPSEEVIAMESPHQIDDKNDQEPNCVMTNKFGPKDGMKATSWKEDCHKRLDETAQKVVPTKVRHKGYGRPGGTAMPRSYWTKFKAKPQA